MKLYQKRSFGEKINATFEFLKENIKPLGYGYLYYIAPITLLEGIITSVMQFQTGGTGITPSTFFTYFGSFGLLSIILQLLFISFFTCIIYGYMTQYARYGKPENFSLQTFWEYIRNNALNVIAIMITIGAITMVGFIFFIIPGIVLALAFSFAYIIYFEERKSISQVLDRCFKIVSDNYFSTLGLLFIVFLIQFSVMGAFTMVLGLFGYLKGMFAPQEMVDTFQDPSLLVQIGLVLYNIVSSVVQGFIYSIIMIAIGFQYYHLREKKEAASLMHDINRIDNTASGSNQE